MTGTVRPGTRAIKAENNDVQILFAVKAAGRSAIAASQNTPARFDGGPQLAAEPTTELDAALQERGADPRALRGCIGGRVGPPRRTLLTLFSGGHGDAPLRLLA